MRMHFGDCVQSLHATLFPLRATFPFSNKECRDWLVPLNTPDTSRTDDAIRVRHAHSRRHSTASARFQNAASPRVELAAVDREVYSVPLSRPPPVSLVQVAQLFSAKTSKRRMQGKSCIALR